MFEHRQKIHKTMSSLETEGRKLREEVDKCKKEKVWREGFLESEQEKVAVEPDKCSFTNHHGGEANDKETAGWS